MLILSLEKGSDGYLVLFRATVNPLPTPSGLGQRLLCLRLWPITGFASFLASYETKQHYRSPDRLALTDLRLLRDLHPKSTVCILVRFY